MASKIINLSQLKEHEQVEPKHLEKIKNQILKDGILKRPIIVDKNGIGIMNFAETILNIKIFNEIFYFKDSQEKITVDYNLISELQQKAKIIIKSKTSNWKREIKILNDNIFNREMKKKEKIYSHKKRSLNLKLESLHQILDRNKNRRHCR